MHSHSYSSKLLSCLIILMLYFDGLKMTQCTHYYYYFFFFFRDK